MEVLVAILVVTAAVALAVAVWAIRSRSATEVAVRSLAERLAPGDPEVVSTSAVATLERAIGDAQAARHEAEGIRAHLQRSLNAIPQGVIIADDAGEIVSRNDVATLFAEARHGDALVQAAIEELLAEALDGLPGRRTVELFETPRRTLVISATPLDEDGRLTGAMVVVDDISERRRLDAVRRDFVANISHELKTPVAAMSLLAETLAGEDDPEVTRRLAERVQSEAFRVNRTIEDLLALSRIETEEGLERTVVPVAAVIDEAIERTRAAAERADILVGIEVDDPDLALVGDRRQLVSALANLLDNAIKYSDPGTDVTVAAVVRGETIELSVADHGIGIPARDLERVFERFYRVDQARSRETGGTGLGLAIVRHVAVNHHGRVEVRSRTGEGSTFTLRLPAAPPNPTTGYDTSRPTTPASGRPAPVPTPIGRQAGR
jgi:two-component system sensor histidine kinase SenX3